MSKHGITCHSLLPSQSDRQQIPNSPSVQCGKKMLCVLLNIIIQMFIRQEKCFWRKTTKISKTPTIECALTPFFLCKFSMPAREDRTCRKGTGYFIQTMHFQLAEGNLISERKIDILKN